MSLLSRERLVVSLAPERMSALRLGGFRQHLLLDQYASALPQATGVSPWTPGLEALELLLDDAAWSGHKMTMVLASHYVRYAVLPMGKLLSTEEQTGLARLIFRNVFGDLANDWELRVSPAGRRPTLACGIPKALLADLRAACEGRGQLASIQPGLMAVFNRARASVDRHDGTLALVESGRITLATVGRGDWQSITSRAWEAAALPELLAEMKALSGGPAGGWLWLCDLTGQAVPPATPSWQLERLVSGTAGAASLAAWGAA